MTSKQKLYRNKRYELLIDISKNILMLCLCKGEDIERIPLKNLEKIRKELEGYTKMINDIPKLPRKIVISA